MSPDASAAPPARLAAWTLGFPVTEGADLLDLHVAALFTQDEHGNLVATNDPEADRVAAPRLYLGRSRSRAVVRFRSGMDEATRAALRELAAPDLASRDVNVEPVNRAAMEDLLAAEQPIENIYFGAAFSFPESTNPESPSFRQSREGGNPGPIYSSHSQGAKPLQVGHTRGNGNPFPSPPEVIEITPSNTSLLKGEFAWLAEELAVRNPVVAMVVNGAAVSVCFSARATRDASEAGVETLPEHRGRRHAGAVTTAWAAEVRRQGRIPLYSTSWTNHASRRVAARLGLIQYATDFHIT